MHEKIIQFLKETDSYVSGEEMSQKLNMSRAAIWKYMQELRGEGYDIVAVPHLGYQLVTSPDKLLSHEVQFNLKTKFMGQTIYSFDSLTSTMDEAFRLGMEGALEGTVVCAEAQTKGRGRMGRVWVSPKGKGIYCSIILRPKLPPSKMPQVTLMTAVALAEALRRMTSIQPQIKWPNDLLIGSKKLAGILTELRAEVDQMNFVVIGIGLNINASPSQLLDTATSLKIESDQTWNRVEVFQEVLRSMELWYTKILKGDFAEVLEYCKEHSSTLKKRVRITESTGELEGEAINIDSDGALLIRLDSGKTIKKTAGDVRPI
ncbi:MAG: biotin--[acetyl-CoA-carboxylase] ligase [Candidatus Omnitrophica bacterium]|nr:biotin--[acetyl-CoA-carboxylase] ligase [Candidatus Omnitrophota bacterium]